jgi:hypothetical protein
LISTYCSECKNGKFTTRLTNQGLKTRTIEHEENKKYTNQYL